MHLLNNWRLSPEDSSGKSMQLKWALGFVFCLTLGYALYIAVFMRPSEEIYPLNLNLFNTGEWKQSFPFEPYHDGSAKLKAEILDDSTAGKFFRIKALNDSIDYSGVAFHINRAVPENANLSIKWRGHGKASLLIIDVMDGSRVDSTGKGDSTQIIGETFFAESHAPENKWSSFILELDTLPLNPSQPSGKSLNGVFDFNPVRQVSISICPGSDFTLDVKDVHFYWTTNKWAMASVLFILSLAGLLLIIRTKPEKLFTDRGTAYNINALIPRIAFCLVAISAMASVMLRSRSFADTSNLALYGALTALIVTEEFLVFLKPNPLWSLRYAIVVFTGYFMGFSGGILAFSFMILASCIPLISEKIKEIFWAVIALAIIAYIAKPLQDNNFTYFTGLITIAGSCAVAVILREYLRQQHKDFVLGQAILQYEALFKKTSDAIFVLNETGEIVTVNQSFERLTGYRLKELSGQRITSFVCPDSEETVKDMLKAGEGTGSQQYDIHFAHRSRSVRTALVRCSPIYRKKNIAGYQALATDITERKMAEEKLADTVKLLESKAGELARLNEQLRDLNISKDKFFSIISHDLKNPFSSLLGFSDLLVKDFATLDKDEIKMFAENINGGIKKVYNLLNNLLQWASIQSGKMQYEARILRLHQLAEESADVLVDTAAAKGINIKNNVEKKVLVYADLYSISSVIQNLITNAIKFTNPGGTVEISSARTDKMVSLSVSDTGIGMTKEEMEKLFRIDVQHTTTGTAKESGTGLGLILCKEMVEKNGGMISVESQPGQGSRFTFTLPVFEPETQQLTTKN